LVFGPVRVSLKTDHGPRLYHFLVRSYAYSRNYQYLNLETACYYLGQVRLGDKTHKVALVDNNANGAFNDLSTSPWDGDRLLIDLNDDGQFAVNAAGSPETFPMSKLLQVGDGYVAVEAAPDGSSLAMSVPDLKLGQVQSDGAFQITLISSAAEGVLRVKSEDGQAKVPVGEYRLYETAITRKDDQGRRWELSSSSRGEMPTIKVAADTTTELKLGSPLQARVSARVSGRSVSFSLELTDAAGLAATVTLNGQRPAAPKLRIKRADGKEIGRYDFHYG
jgi:hypothetical protein